MSVSQTILYRLGAPDHHVFLKVIVGEAQTGASVVRLGSALLEETNDSEFTVELGLGSEVAGKKCFCTTVVTDINPQTNGTAVTWELHGGFTDYTKTCTLTLDQDGDSILYSAVIYLV
jgi:hypothetical protein